MPRGARKNLRVDVLKQIIERDGASCRYCGSAAERFGWRNDMRNRLRPWVVGLQIEHVVPVALGGTNDLSNLVLACESCNRRKGTKEPFPMLPPRPCVFPEKTAANVLRDDFDPTHW